MRTKILGFNVPRKVKLEDFLFFSSASPQMLCFLNYTQNKKKGGPHVSDVKVKHGKQMGLNCQNTVSADVISLMGTHCSVISLD